MLGGKAVQISAMKDCLSSHQSHESPQYISGYIEGIDTVLIPQSMSSLARHISDVNLIHPSCLGNVAVCVLNAFILR